MNKHEFARLISEIRNEKIDQVAAEQAAHRAWNGLTGEKRMDTIRIQGCSDFQALIPAFLKHSLTPARTMLLEDHTHECVACRRALDSARSGNDTAAIPFPSTRRGLQILPWAMAAMLLLGIGIGSYGAFHGLLPGQHSIRATVQSIEGSLYRVSDQGATLLSSGHSITDGDEIRTTRGSRAVVRLNDGSLVEMGERTDLAVFRGWRGATVRLERGPVIIQAARQRLGRLYVSTEDCLVSVKGTVFSVNHGTKGSRVSVIQGSVQVDQGAKTVLLKPGQQTTTSADLSPVPIQDEIAWSKNAVQYLALLGEFSTLQKQLAAIPGPGLRYQSNLAKYVPENTAIYAAIPNIGTTLEQASGIFEARLHESAVLRDWWRQQQSSHGLKFQDTIDKIKALSSYLGDEIVIAVSKNGAGSYASPLILAEAHQSGLRGFLEAQAPGESLRIVDNPAFAQANQGGLNVYLKNNMLAASTDVNQLRGVGTLIDQEAGSRFPQSPFYSRIAQSYQSGAGWLLAADMEQIVSASVKNDKDLPPGIKDVQYLVVERREVGSQTETSASLSFNGQRQGMAAWLASPGPMGSLDFVSPTASLAVSFVIKNPGSVVEELLNYASTKDPAFSQDLAEFESKTGVNVVNDIAAPLGGEVTFTLDGPLLPVPSWKMICEVDNPTLLQGTISKLVQSFNTMAPANAGQIQLTQEQQGSQIFYTLTSTRQTALEIDYTFVDGYWIAAANRALLLSAIQNRENGYTLPKSAAFRAQLPSNGYANFSAIFYHNLGTALLPLADQAKAAGLVTPEQQKSIDALKANGAPGLIYAYGEPDKIVVASSSGFLGMNLDTLLTVNTGGFSMLPQMIHNLTKPK